MWRTWGRGRRLFLSTRVERVPCCAPTSLPSRRLGARVRPNAPAEYIPSHGTMTSARAPCRDTAPPSCLRAEPWYDTRMRGRTGLAAAHGDAEDELDLRNAYVTARLCHYRSRERRSTEYFGDKLVLRADVVVVRDLRAQRRGHDPHTREPCGVRAGSTVRCAEELQTTTAVARDALECSWARRGTHGCYLATTRVHRRRGSGRR